MKKTLPYLILTVILLMSFFKYWLLDAFSVVVSSFVQGIGSDPGALLDFLNKNSNYSEYQDHYLGWFLYYPLFFGLHFLFVIVLFKGQTRTYILLAVVGVVLLLFALMGLGKLIGSYDLFYISSVLFQNLFALPFLLLVIEGGRILLNDINRHLE